MAHEPRPFGIVPPHLLSRLAGCDIPEVRDAAAATQERARIAREHRATRARGQVAAPQADGANGERTVYDCGHTWRQRVGDPVRAEGDDPAEDADVNDAFDHAGTVREYFRTIHGRDSVDGSGFPLILNVHYGVKYMNAYWDGDEMTFGDGDGRVFIGFAGSLDVVGHELGHGVTQYTCGLVYRGQSGALNEHLSDVWGSAITQWANDETATTADWLIGDEVLAPSLAGQALRSMKAPGTAYDNPLMGKDPQPAHMSDYNTDPADNGGVHINSGIPNKAFYLTATQVGTPAAAAIWYQGMTALAPTARFNDAVTAMSTAARTLSTSGSVPVDAEQAVLGAFAEVGLPT
jgi:Zn-dependent metalloprotease